jgi:hypothetical protein
MKKNVGFLDSLIRIIMAAVIFTVAIIHQSWWGLVGLVPFLTGIIGFCPIYTILHINTLPKK